MALLNNTYLADYKKNKTMRDVSEQGSDAWQQYNSQMGSAVGGAALTALNGAAGILDTTLQMAQAPDITQYQNQINQLGNFRDGKTWDINQMMENRAASMPTHTYTYDEIGGISDEGIALGTLSSAASGAMTGLQVGGPWGALIGGVVGAGAGLWGGMTGKDKAEGQVALLNKAADHQAWLNERYFNNQVDKINDFNYSNLYANRAAEGGSIERKQDSLREFADKVLRGQKNNDVTHSAGIVRQRCKGGTMIRIKTK